MEQRARADESAGERPGEAAVVLYDHDCGFCRWTINRLTWMDRRGELRPLAIQSEEGARLLADLSPEQRLDSWHLVTADGRRHSAGAAIAPLARLLPAGGPIAALAARYPGAAERLYRGVANRRAAFGRLLRAAPRGPSATNASRHCTASGHSPCGRSR